MKLENFSLLYPDGQTQNDHLAGRDVPDIDMYTLQELGRYGYLPGRVALFVR